MVLKYSDLGVYKLAIITISENTLSKMSIELFENFSNTYFKFWDGFVRALTFNRIFLTLFKHIFLLIKYTHTFKNYKILSF